MANKETRIIKSNTLEEFRQKTNEVSLHLGDNEQLNASLTDKTFDFANVSAGDTLFDANDNNSKTVEFNIKSEETLDNTGGYIILKGSPTLTGFVADATVTQTGGYSATIVSVSSDKILVKNSIGTFDSTKNLTVGSNNIPNANIVRIIAEAYNVGVVRVYINNAEISQNLLAGGFHVANSSSTIPLLNNPSITDFNEGATIYQGGALGTATFSATVLSATSTQLRLKNHTGSFSATTLIKVDGSAATITGANHGDLSNRDITIGNVIELNTPAAANDDIRIFSSSVVDAVNELQDDVGIIENLEASLGTDVVTALNNIESVFDASAYGISAGAAAFDITSGNLTFDTDGDIVLDAAGSQIFFKQNGTQFAEFQNQGSNLKISSGSSTMLTGSGSDATFANDLTVTQDVSVVRNLDVDGITTLDQTTVDGTFNVTGATDLDTTLNVDGATTLIGQLNTRANNFLGNGITDDTTISGDLIVAVDGTVGGNFTVNGTEAEINANLDVNGNADVSGTTDLHGVVEINNTLGVDGNFRVGSSNNNYFNVDAATGSTQIDGNLEVDGTIGVDGNFRIGGTNYTDATFKVDHSNGNTIISGTTDITGNLTVGSLGTTSQNVLGSLNELHTQVGTVLFPGPTGLDNTTTLSVLDPTNLTTALIALDHEIGDTDSYNDGTYGAATIAGTLDLLQAGMISNDTNITDLFADVGDLSLDTSGSDLTAAVNELHGEINSNDTDIGNIMKLIDGVATVDSSISFTGLAGTNLKDAVIELAAEKLDINTGGTSGAIGRINAGTDSIQSIVSRLNLTGNVTFANGGNNANTMTFNTGTTLDMSNASLLLPGNASNVNIFSTSFLEVDGNVETPMGFSVDRQHVTLTDKADVKIQWHENYADGTSQSRPARAWQLVGLTDGGSSNTADIVTYYNAKELIGNNTESGINVTWDSTAQNFDLDVDDFTVTLGTGPISGSFTITDLASTTFNTSLDNNSVTLGTHTVGNYVADVNGTTYEINSSHTPSEGSTATLSIPTDFRMPGTARVLSTAQSSLSSATDGALVVDGGASIAKNLYVGGDLIVKGSEVKLEVSTLEVEDTLILAGNNLSSEPSSGGFGIETGPITSPSGVASGVTGAHSIVYNYGTDQWEADGSLILSNATNTPPTIESNAFGAGKNLDFVNGTGISIVTTTSGNDIDVQITNTLDGYSGWFLSVQNADKGNIADDERVDFFGGTALTATYDTTNTNRVTFNHDNITTTTSAATDDGTYIKGLTINAQGHVTNIDSGDFDDYYNNYVLPLASSTDRGGIKIGYTESGKNYPVELSSEKAYVNVPWTDTTYGISCVDGGVASEEKIRLSDGTNNDDIILASSTGLTIARAGDKITYTNSAPNVTTNLSKTVSGDGFSINSSDGNNVALSLADTDNWGIMSDEMFDKLDGIATGAQVNVATNINVTESNDTVTVESSTGSDDTIGVANSTNGTNGHAGVMSRAQAAKLHNIAAGATATNENTITNISITHNVSDAVVVSSDGTNGTINAATKGTNGTDGTAGVMSSAQAYKLHGIATGATNTSAPFYTSAVPGAISEGAAGLMSGADKKKLDDIAENATATVGNATHTGDVTGSGALTIGSNKVTNVHLADMAANTIKGRITTAGDPQNLSAANVRTIINVDEHANFGFKAAYGYGSNLGAGYVFLQSASSSSGNLYFQSGSGITLGENSNFNGTGHDAMTITNSSPNVTTNLSTTTSTSSVTVNSSDGTNATISEATGSAAGVMSVAHHNKLDNIAANANNYTYTLPTYPANMNQYVRTTDTVQFGIIRSTGDIVAYYSDDRLKNRIGNIESALDKVNQLNGFTFTPNEESVRLGLDPEGKVRVGVSAQEVEAVLPEAVTDAPVENDQGYKTVQYDKMVPLLIEAIKELTEQNKELKSEVEILKSINSR